MKYFVVAWCFFVVTVASPSQQKPPRYITGATIFGSESCPDNSVFVGKVFPISPAASSSLTVGDQLLSIDGEPVKNLQDAAARMSSTSPGTVVLKVKRNGSVHILSPPNCTRRGSQTASDGFRSEILAKGRAADDTITGGWSS